MIRARVTSSQMPGIDRQPSSPVSVPARFVITGFTSVSCRTLLVVERHVHHQHALRTPTWFAASPTPL